MKTADEYLRECIEYDPVDGVFWRKYARNVPGRGRRRYIGTPGPHGYLFFRFRGKSYACHRVAIFLQTGEWPEVVDHANQNRKDNRYSNLRACTRCENAWNRGATRFNRAGFKGVSWSKAAKRWTASIMANGKGKYLGLFDTPEEAARAYNEAAVLLHGRFSKLNYAPCTFPELVGSHRQGE